MVTIEFPKMPTPDDFRDGTLYFNHTAYKLALDAWERACKEIAARIPQETR